VSGAAATVAAAWAAAAARAVSAHAYERAVAAGRLVVPAGLRLAPATVRWACARAGYARGEPPARSLRAPARDLWFRVVSLEASRDGVHPCALRMARHLSWHVDARQALERVPEVLEAYSARHEVSDRTAWTDLGRLVEGGWLAQTRTPANEGKGQGPGTGRTARYVLAIPAEVAANLTDPPVLVPSGPAEQRSEPAPVSQEPAQLRSGPGMTSDEALLSREELQKPCSQDRKWRTSPDGRGWRSLPTPTLEQRRDASAILAGCHNRWRRQRLETALVNHADWDALLPLVAAAHAARPEVDLTEALSVGVRSARNLAGVLAHRCWKLILSRPAPALPALPSPPTSPSTTARQDFFPARNAVGAAAARANLPERFRRVSARRGRRTDPSAPRRRSAAPQFKISKEED